VTEIGDESSVARMKCCCSDDRGCAPGVEGESVRSWGIDDAIKPWQCNVDAVGVEPEVESMMLVFLCNFAASSAFVVTEGALVSVKTCEVTASAAFISELVFALVGNVGGLQYLCATPRIFERIRVPWRFR